jgi:hypothetical protein
MVRVEPKVQEFATLMTAMRMTALKIDGRTLIPASWMAMTKGEYLEVGPSPWYASLFAGTINPMRNRLTM